MKEGLEKFIEQARGEIAAVRNLAELENLEIKFLGRKGELRKFFDILPSLAPEKKSEAGQLLNRAKGQIIQLLREKKNFLLAESRAPKGKKLDITLPLFKTRAGHQHPISQVSQVLEDLFLSMGFMVLDGPELESDFYNFEALNIPPEHPAREMQDTFYIKDKPNWLLRTHTSSVQVRAMKKYRAPLRAIAPGRCFRSEATDIRHEHTFYQLEGFLVDKDINFAHMKGFLELVVKKLYGEETKLRLLPKFYPFVEPGARGEVSCFICRGKGCGLCKMSGWLEILGAGLVHPNVLKAGGLNPKIWSGFAFGFGLNRIAQLKYGIDDVRLFNSGDLRFLEQF